MIERIKFMCPTSVRWTLGLALSLADSKYILRALYQKNLILSQDLNGHELDSCHDIMVFRHLAFSKSLLHYLHDDSYLLGVPQYTCTVNQRAKHNWSWNSPQQSNQVPL